MIVKFSQGIPQCKVAPQIFQFRCRNGRKVHGVGNHLAAKDIDDFLGYGKAHLILSLKSAGPKVGRHNALRHPDEGRDGIGFIHHNVKPDACYDSFLHCFGKVLFIVKPAAGTVDDANTFLALLPFSRAQHIDRLFRLRRVDGNDIRFFQQIIQGLTFFHTKALKTGIRDIRIIGNDAHIKGMHALCNKSPNAAKPNDAKRFMIELAAFEVLAFPDAFFEHLVGPDRIAAACKQETDGMFSGRNDIGFRRIDHNDAPFGGTVKIDIIHTIASPANHLEFFCRIIQLLVDLCHAADNEGIIIPNDL